MSDGPILQPMSDYTAGFLHGFLSTFIGVLLGMVVSWLFLRRLERVVRRLRTPRARRARLVQSARRHTGWPRTPLRVVKDSEES